MNKLLACLVAVQFVVILVLLGRGRDAAPSGAPPVGVRQSENAKVPAPAESQRDIEPDAAERGAEPPRRERSEAEPTQATRSRVVWGRVVDRAGAHVGGLRLYLSRDGSRYGSYEQSAEDGSFAFAGVRPGPWTIRAEATGYVPSFVEFELGPGSTPHFVEVLVSVAHRIEVEVLASDGRTGRELFQAMELPFQTMYEVIATAAAPEGPFPVAIAGRLGDYGLGRWASRAFDRPTGTALEGRPDGVIGVLELHADPPLWLSLAIRGERLATQRLPALTERVRFTISEADLAASLSGLGLRVLAHETGAPLPQVEVRMHAPQGGPVSVQRSDANGEVSFANQPAGLQLLQIQVPGREAYRRAVRLPAGERRELGEQRLAEALQFRGRILDPSGAPCGQAKIHFHVTDDMHDLQPAQRAWTPVSDAEGYFHAGNLGRRRYLWVADKGEDLHAHGILDLSAGAPAAFELRLRPAHLVQLEAPELGAEWLYFKIIDGEGVPCASGALQSRRAGRARLPDGRYQVLVHDGRRELHRLPLHVAGSDTTLRVR